MTFDEALEAAVLGERVRAVNMMPGTYVDYQFNGWRINHAGGSSSGYSFKDIDRESEWELMPWPEPEPVNIGWDTAKINPSSLSDEEKAGIEASYKFCPPKRGRKPRWTPPAEIDDIDDAPKVEPEPKNNPWAGLTKEPKPASGWAIFSEDKEQ